MDELILDIAAHIARSPHHSITPNELAGIIRVHNAGIRDVSQHHSKKKLYPYFLRMKSIDPDYWQSRGIDAEDERAIAQALQMKPRRTASGVATITVITKPWKCSGTCVFCPNDIRMPKSYLHNEPACQRAERNFFDPYLQVASRLKALMEMGHPTDKIELIVLGGTWFDYPLDYQIWFITRLFEALNDGDAAIERAPSIRMQYKDRGFANGNNRLGELTASVQRRIDEGAITYNNAWDEIYGASELWKSLEAVQRGDSITLDAAQRTNERASHRVVGLVVETRPDSITAQRCAFLRRLGCTKVQIGIQSLQADVLAQCGRTLDNESLAHAFELIRLFGFKIHAHFMVNLPGSTPDADTADYQHFVEEPAWLPDEVKLYPTVLVKGTMLCQMYEQGDWTPYTNEELIDVLVADTLATPAFMRISRMIRDISATDILAGNKKTNLRQMVEQRVEAASKRTGKVVQEIRYREISTSDASIDELTLDEVFYETTVSKEFFLQWITPDKHIAGFLRMSLPHRGALASLSSSNPCKTHLESAKGETKNEEDSIVNAASLSRGHTIHAGGCPHEGEAMIREVHIYGHAAQLHKTSRGAQHQGLGRQLIERACDIARSEGYTSLNVISSVGTREYYRKLGFADFPLYQKRKL